MPSRQLLKETADQKTLDRIAHSKECPHWSIIENHCECELYKAWDKLTPEQRLTVARYEQAKKDLK